MTGLTIGLCLATFLLLGVVFLLALLAHHHADTIAELRQQGGELHARNRQLEDALGTYRTWADAHIDAAFPADHQEGGDAVQGHRSGARDARRRLGRVRHAPRVPPDGAGPGSADQRCPSESLGRCFVMPRTGDIVHIGADCGVQFRGRPINLRVIRVLNPADSHRWPGMTWIDGYELDHHNRAVESRQVYVIAAGLRPISTPPAALRRPHNGAPVVIPRQRSPHATTTGRTR
jgi:hypothetical protein